MQNQLPELVIDNIASFLPLCDQAEFYRILYRPVPMNVVRRLKYVLMEEVYMVVAPCQSFDYFARRIRWKGSLKKRRIHRGSGIISRYMPMGKYLRYEWIRRSEYLHSDDEE
jgi:hypothetical protein